MTANLPLAVLALSPAGSSEKRAAHGGEVPIASSWGTFVLAALTGAVELLLGEESSGTGAVSADIRRVGGWCEVVRGRAR